MVDDTPIYVIPLSKETPRKISLVRGEPDSRYMTRQLQVQVVGKSKMIKTVLVNILDVSKDMQLPPTCTSSFFFSSFSLSHSSDLGTFIGYEIGAQAKFDAKKPERQQAFISGEHDTKDLSKIVGKFIDEVVLCPECALPETSIEVEGKKVIGKCRSCGFGKEMQISNEKFRRYILNHPPVSSGTFSGSRDVQKREGKKKNSVEKTEAKVAKEKKLREKPIEENHQEEVIWYSDTSDEAARKRREAMLPDTLRPPTQQDMDELKRLLVNGSRDELAKKKSSENISDSAFIEQLFNAVMGDSSNPDDFVRHKETVKEFVKSNEAQAALLFCVEKFCVKTNPAQLPKLPLILKQFYDEDLLEEEEILKWSEKTTEMTAKQQAAPFIKWLQEAEEESSGEEADD